MAVSWIGHTLNGRYRIEELLGQGGMSSVYKATDPNLRRVVAVKMIHPHLSGNPDFVRRFEEEAAAVAQLRHPNIVQVYDFNHDAGNYYMVLEFLPGETLQSRLERLNAQKRRLSLKDALGYISEVGEAAQYAHERGMVHRDIKPANIMLDIYGHAILMDFGIARIVGGQLHTATGAVVGTAMYMSPEQIIGERADERSDIYSLGVTLFESISGRPPFQSDSAMTLMMMHINDPVPDLRELTPEVPHLVVRVVEKALEKKRENRYQSMREMIQAMRSAQARMEEQARLAEPPRRVEMATMIEPLPVVPVEPQPAQQPSASPVEPPVEPVPQEEPFSAVVQTAVTPEVNVEEQPAAKSPEPLLQEPQSVPLVPVGLEQAPAQDIFTPVVETPPAEQVAPAAQPQPVDMDATFDSLEGTARPRAHTDLVPTNPLDDDSTLVEDMRMPPGAQNVTTPAQPGPIMSRQPIAGTADGPTIDEPVQIVRPVPKSSIVKPVPQRAPEPLVRQLPNKMLLIAGGAVALVAVIIILIGVLRGGQPSTPAPTDVAAVLFTTTPTEDTNAVSTQVAGTIQAGIVLTSTAQAILSAPTATSYPEPTATQAYTATPEPPTQVPTATIPPGTQYYARILSISIKDGYYVVEYETVGYTEAPNQLHVHFFYDTVKPEDAGVGGAGTWIMWAGPRPFSKYSVASRPYNAMKMCILVANPDHTIQLNTGNCIDLPNP